MCPDLPAADACLETVQGWMWCTACPAAPTDFLALPAAIYLFVWAVPYFVLVLWILGPWAKATGHEMLFDYFATVQPSLVERFRVGLGPFVGEHLAPRLGYMGCHFLSVIVVGSASFVFWHSFALHTAFTAWIASVAIHNGSTYTFRYFAFRYVDGMLKKHPVS